ncbi:DUF1513 domain-containing protein [Aliiroseovarius sediminis]|uniref:DUF1513 domain-containing protein n=1 Tax=Aliiroseovarius sediminis TaxID=2925839 RepID=UPI001F563644|nr:DUF1513 domain-containing protein [Aliiroseovarius sediminis]MCI2394255.1 DUF1513 domain-containing protein [Aliiroseovarius sediminis]
MKRRHFLAGACASLGLGSITSQAWAAAGAPDFITAANRADLSSWLVGLTRHGDVVFDIPIPSRGHAAAVNPRAPEAVAFARRPGRFAIIIDCAAGQEVARLQSPKGRHFYGHGAFSSDGKTLFTTENNFDAPAGVLGIWDASDGYRRLGEVPSGGIGPHEILRLPDGGFAVANGGIQTHPEMARAKLNLPTMQTNLTYLSDNGTIHDQTELTGVMHQNSIRHIALDDIGNVVAALQWQGPPTKQVPLVLRNTPGGQAAFLPHPDQARLKNYAGSVAVCPQTGDIAVTGPKGSTVIYFDADGQPHGWAHHSTASGVAPAPDGGLTITCDGGMVHRANGVETPIPVSPDLAWDNHLIAV